MGKRLQTTASVTCMKILLMIFNFIFWVTGIALLVVGILTKVQLYTFLELSDNYDNTVPYVLIGTGAGIILVSFLACCCTVKGQPVLLYLLSVFLVLVFLLEIVAAISGYVFRNNITKGFSSGLHKSLQGYGHGGMKDRNFDSMQTNLNCCGSNNYTDWFATEWSNGQPVVPKSCCKNSSDCKTLKEVDVSTPDGLNKIHTNGCYNVVIDFMDGNLASIAGGVLGIAFFQLLGVVLACCLAKHVNKTKYEQVA